MTRLRDVSGAATDARDDRHDAGPQAPSGATPKPRVHVARAELVLARAAHLPLGVLDIRRQDPLQSMAAAITDVRPDLGETVEACVDLVPLTPARVGHLARRATRSGSQDTSSLTAMAHGLVRGTGSLLWEILQEFLPHSREAAASASRPSGPARVGGAEPNKFAITEPVFAVQVLLRCTSEIPGRAQSHLRALIGAFDVYRGENWWRVRGIRVPGRHLGADTVFYRRSFDRRFASGLARPAATSVVTVSEIAALLKPPTRHCESLAVLRSRGWVPPAPRELPTYVPGKGLVRLGYINDINGEERLVGVPWSEVLFSARFGKAGYGKTEQALAQAIDIARAGGGVWFLDPHADGWRRAKPYLADPALRPRLWEVDLTVRGPNHRLPSWNPLSMEGFSEEHIEDRVDAVVTSFTTALGWADTANRAKAILTKACEALCWLALRLPPECAPTIFQLPTLLDDELWRTAVLPVLPPSVRRYWETAFPKISAEATPVITNAVNRLRTSRTLSAFLGASRSTYDVRHAMDTGKIVFVCTPGSGESNKLLTSFLIYDLFRAGRSRADIPPEKRRRADAFVDELAAVDGASRGHLAAILEQLRKYRVALHAMNQMPDRLTGDTRRALLQNQSVLMTSAAAVDGARTVAREFGQGILPGTVVELERFHHIVTATLAGQRTTPFRLRGLHVDDEYAEHYHPEWAQAVDTALDDNLSRRPVGEILAELETLDERILRALSDGPAYRSPRGPSRAATRGSGAGIDLTGPVGLDGDPTRADHNDPDDGHRTPRPYTSTVE